MDNTRSPGDARKHAGIDTVLENDSAEFQENYRVFAKLKIRALRSGRHFILEDINSAYRESALPKPHHHNAYSAMSRAVKNELVADNVIAHTQHRWKAKRGARHSNMVDVYVRL